MALLEIRVDPAARFVVAEEKLWLNGDRSRLVADGDEEAAFLFCLPGQRVGVADAERYGLVKTEKAAPVEEPDAEGGVDETVLGEPLEALAAPVPVTGPGLTVEPESKRSSKVKKKG